MFIAALFITDKTWKRPKRPSLVDRINRLGYDYTMEYYISVRKINKMDEFYKHNVEKKKPNIK